MGRFLLSISLVLLVSCSSDRPTADTFLDKIEPLSTCSSPGKEEQLFFSLRRSATDGDLFQMDLNQGKINKIEGLGGDNLLEYFKGELHLLNRFSVESVVTFSGSSKRETALPQYFNLQDLLAIGDNRTLAIGYDSSDVYEFDHKNGLRSLFQLNAALADDDGMLELSSLSLSPNGKLVTVLGERIQRNKEWEPAEKSALFIIDLETEEVILEELIPVKNALKVEWLDNKTLKIWGRNYFFSGEDGVNAIFSFDTSAEDSFVLSSFVNLDRPLHSVDKNFVILGDKKEASLGKCLVGKDWEQCLSDREGYSALKVGEHCLFVGVDNGEESFLMVYDKINGNVLEKLQVKGLFNSIELTP